MQDTRTTATICNLGRKCVIHIGPLVEISALFMFSRDGRRGNE